MDIAHRAMRIAADCCVYTNNNFGARRAAALPRCRRRPRGVLLPRALFLTHACQPVKC